MNRSDLAQRLDATCRLTGEFQLRSGTIATSYFDKYRMEADPELLAAVVAELVPLIPEDTEVLAGLELGGVPIATALSLSTGLPACFVRKEAKTYGTCQLAEGADVNGRRTLVVEDVITTGGQVATSTAQLREVGALVDTVVCVVDRSAGNHPPIDKVALNLRSAFTFDELGG